MGALAVSQTGVGLSSPAELEAMLKQIEVREYKASPHPNTFFENTKASVELWCFWFEPVFGFQYN